MSTLKNKLQHLIEGQIPEYLRTRFESLPPDPNAPPLSTFAIFIKEYYKFLDENRQVNAVLLNSSSWSDVDLTLELFVQEMRKQYAYDIPEEVLVDHRRLIKFINQYYESKGTENAAELFFRMMYNDTATIKYPGDYVLRPSDNVWTTKKIIKIDTDYDQIDPQSLSLAPAPIRENAEDVFSLKERTFYLKYYRREPTGNVLYSYELGCVQVGRIITNKDIYELEIYTPPTLKISELNEILSTQAYYDTVWVTSFDNNVEYVYGFLTQQLIGYTIDNGGENFVVRDTFTVEVAETSLYPIPGQENNNGIIRVSEVSDEDVQEYFASDYVSSDSFYTVRGTEGIIRGFKFISTGHRFDITGDYFEEAYVENDNYTTYKDFTRSFENPRIDRFVTLIRGDYFAEREGTAAYMEFNDENGYTDFDETTYNATTATVTFQVGYVYEHPGKWKNNASFLSDINRLQDNYYYQDFSYVVQTRITPYETWNSVYKNSAHPAGFAVFGELLTEDHITFPAIDITSKQHIILNFIENVQPVDSLQKTSLVYLTDVIVASGTYAIDYFAEVYTASDVMSYSLSTSASDSVELSDQTIAGDNDTVFLNDAVTVSDAATISVSLSLVETVDTADSLSTEANEFYVDEGYVDVGYVI